MAYEVSTFPMPRQARERGLQGNLPGPIATTDAAYHRDEFHKAADGPETSRDGHWDWFVDKAETSGRARGSIGPSPEVISSLITSLSDISMPATTSNTVTANTPSRSPSPRSGSPTPAKSPRMSASRDTPGRARVSTGRYTFHASRTSSMVSASESIGNPSIEPGPVSRGSQEIPRAHFDSWGKKSGRRGLGHQNSRERIRGKEAEKAKCIDGLASGSSNTPTTTATTVISRTDRSEERQLETNVESLLNIIPARDSSLRLAPFVSRRQPRSSQTPFANTIEAIVDDGPSESMRQQQTVANLDLSVNHMSFDLARASRASASFSRPQPHGYGAMLTVPRSPLRSVSADLEDCAPAPNVSQRRSRSESVIDSRRRSTRETQGSPLDSRQSFEHASRDTRADHAHVAYERSASADSIDDEVGKYLGNPRLSQTIKHAETGRVISFSEVGDPNGSAVFCCVGMGLTRYITAFYDELALTLKLRLITPERPGVGDSQPHVEGTATPLGWPDDVYAICQALRITKFSMIAHSAGAIYALATALRMPQHIRGKMHLLAPWIPPSQMTVLGASAQTPLPPQNAIPTRQRILRALPTPILKAANSSFMSATSSSITSYLPKQKKTKRDRSNTASPRAVSGKKGSDDKENDAPTVEMPRLRMHRSLDPSETLDHIRPVGTGPTTATTATNAGPLDERTQDKDDPFTLSAEDSAELVRERQQTYDDRLTHAIWQLATTGANPAVDLLVCLERRHPIGFRYVDITRPVVIHHGARDTRVPVDNVRWLAKTMRRCEVRVLDSEGHGLMASAPVMGAVLMEVSREWEEWGRVTGATEREGEKERERAREVVSAIGTAR